MQYELKYTKTFRRSYKRAKKRGLDVSLLGEVVEMLRCGKELPEKYSDHWLTGDYSKCRECHIKPDLLLIYETGEDSIQLVRLGSHSELFG